MEQLSKKLEQCSNCALNRTKKEKRFSKKLDVPLGDRFVEPGRFLRQLNKDVEKMLD